jgi:hypothetical protein
VLLGHHPKNWLSTAKLVISFWAKILVYSHSSDLETKKPFDCIKAMCDKFKNFQ